MTQSLPRGTRVRPATNSSFESLFCDANLEYIVEDNDGAGRVRLSGPYIYGTKNLHPSRRSAPAHVWYSNSKLNVSRQPGQVAVASNQAGPNQAGSNQAGPNPAGSNPVVSKPLSSIILADGKTIIGFAGNDVEADKLATTYLLSNPGKVVDKFSYTGSARATIATSWS